MISLLLSQLVQQKTLHILYEQYFDELIRQLCMSISTATITFAPAPIFNLTNFAKPPVFLCFDSEQLVSIPMGFKVFWNFVIIHYCVKLTMELI